MKKIYSFIKEIRKIELILERVEVSWKVLIPSIILSALSGVFKVLELRFLMAFISGIIYQNFDSTLAVRLVSKIPPFSAIGSNYYFTLIVSILGVLFFGVISSCLSYTSKLSLQSKIRSIECKLRSLIFHRYLTLGKAFFDNKGFSNLHSTLLRTSSSAIGVLQNLHDLARSVIRVIAYLIVLAMISLPITLITIIIFSGISIIGFYIEEKFNQETKKLARAQWNLDRKIFHIISCLPLVQAHNQEENERLYFEKASEEELEFSYNKSRIKMIISEAQHIISLTAIVGLAILIVNTPSEVFSISSGRVLSFLFIVRIMTNDLYKISNLASAALKGLFFIDTVEEILGSKSDMHIVHSGGKQLSNIQSSIEFKNVTFGYNQKKSILNNISFKIKKGHMVGIVGSSGSGKSTIAHLLLRFYDVNSGSIRINDIDIKEYSLHSLRTRLGLVSQDIYMFNDTIKYNISYGIDDIEDHRINSVLQDVKLDKLIEEFPEGIDSHIGDRGSTLSGGERQRASIARSILRESDVLILDEPSSALDSNTEQLIQEYVQNSTKEKTLIVIAHRLSTIKMADQIIVLDDGQIVESGTFSELIANKAHFYSFYEKQKLDT